MTRIFLFFTCLKNLICVTRPLGGSSPETAEDYLCEFQANMTESELIKRVSRKFKELRKEQERNKFFRSCISEGLICKGLRCNVNMACDVNDEVFVGEMKKVQDSNSSRVLDKTN